MPLGHPGGIGRTHQLREISDRSYVINHVRLATAVGHFEGFNRLSGAFGILCSSSSASSALNAGSRNSPRFSDSCSIVSQPTTTLVIHGWERTYARHKSMTPSR